MGEIVAIIQARMGSTRLSGKVMKNLVGKTVLSHLIDRIKQSKFINNIIIATTTNDRDNIIMKEANINGVNCFRGSEDDVLERYYLAAKEFQAETIIRITSDCPLFDSIVLDKMIEFYRNSNYTVVTNAGELKERTFPRGLDTEIFSFSSLEDAYYHANKNYQREHVTPYIYETQSNIYYYKNEVDYSRYRWTLDTEEDWELISKIYDKLYFGTHNFYLKEIIQLMEDYPELYEINKDIEQKKIK